MTPDEALVGPRVLVRPFRLGDVPAVLRYASDPQVTRHLPWEAYDDPATAETFIVSTLRGGGRWFARAIELRESAEVVGGVDLRLVSPEDRVGEIGYALAREFWGRGYASEAAELMIGFGFETVGLDSVQALCARGNQRSIRTLIGLGMVPEPLPWGIRVRSEYERWVLSREAWRSGAEPA